MHNKASRVKKLTVQALSVIQMPNSFPNSTDSTCVHLRKDSKSMARNKMHFDSKENVEEQEFSFACSDLQETLIFADEIFDNGKIRPSFATFNQSIVLTTTSEYNTLPLQPPLKKLFVVEQPNDFSFHSKDILEGSCNEASPKVTMVDADALNDKCKKSKSSGFSKTWRFRENIKLRTNSDGQDAFVLLSPSGSVPMSFQDTKEKNNFPNKGKDEWGKLTLTTHILGDDDTPKDPSSH
ncbi:uncharacterized protein LOC109813839 [Cajanus cajan]|uniref:uncharacterized protein LOC109813839 n=1 Tax=Cajanus cajan TaxID=3821 RepID=UPI00098D8DEB|nr:uncharacterized protein LOC109813839 [Cajanus cajan]